MMTFATLPDLSRMISLMSPIFSLASLSTSTPTSFEARHSPSRCAAAGAAASVPGAAVYAAATPVLRAAIMPNILIMGSTSSFMMRRSNSSGEICVRTCRREARCVDLPLFLTNIAVQPASVETRARPRQRVMSSRGNLFSGLPLDSCAAHSVAGWFVHR
jgi:hypothetical protein